MEVQTNCDHVEVSELMMESQIQDIIKTKVQELVDDSAQQEPTATLSDLLLTCSLKLYQDAMKQLAVSAVSLISYNSMRKADALKQVDKVTALSSLNISSKVQSALSSMSLSKLSAKSCIQSQFVLLKLKYNISYQLCFELLRSYLSKKKLQIIQDYGFKIIFKDKSLNRLTSFLQCIKPLGDSAVNVNYIPSLQAIRMQLIQRSQYKNTHPHYQKMLHHVEQFKRQLWNYGCIQIGYNQAPSFVLQIINKQLSIFNHQKDLQSLVIKYITCKQSVVNKYKNNVFSKLSHSEQVKIQKLISDKLNIYSQFRLNFIQQSKQFAQKKDDINSLYQLPILAKFYGLKKDISYDQIILCERNIDLLQSQTIKENILGLKELSKQIYSIDNNTAHLLPWTIIHLLSIKSGTLLSNLKILEMYFRNQDDYKQLEQFNLNIIFAIDYITNNLQKELKLSK